MSLKRIGELTSRYKVPSKYMYRIPSDNKYISNFGPLKVVVCEETFQARFHFLLHPFIERLFVRYELASV